MIARPLTPAQKKKQLRVNARNKLARKMERARLHKERNREHDRKMQETFSERLAHRMKKMGRMFFFDDLQNDLLVMAKHQDRRNIRGAWVRWVDPEKKRITLLWDQFRYELDANQEGLMVDGDGKVIFLWEYLNLDGTPFKCSIKESKKLTHEVECVI